MATFNALFTLAGDNHGGLVQGDIIDISPDEVGLTVNGCQTLYVIRATGIPVKYGTEELSVKALRELLHQSEHTVEWDKLRERKYRIHFDELNTLKRNQLLGPNRFTSLTKNQFLKALKMKHVVDPDDFTQDTYTPVTEDDL